MTDSTRMTAGAAERAAVRERAEEVLRALRQSAVLDEVQQARLRRRFTDMLVRGYLPREYKEYAKLFRNLQKSQIKSIAPLFHAFLKIHISLPQPFCPHGGKIP